MLNEDFTEVEWVRQTDQVWVIKDRCSARVAAPVPKEPEQLPGPNRARIVPERASTPLGLHSRQAWGQQESTSALSRQGQGGRCRPAHGRELGGSPRRSRNPAVGFRDADPRTVIGAADWRCWRLRAAWNYRRWLRWPPRRCRWSSSTAPGAGLRQGYWEVGQDRRPGRRRAGPLC